MYRFIRLSCIETVSNENELLKCAGKPYFLEVSAGENGFSVKYGMQKCLCCGNVFNVPCAKEPAKDIMSWLLNGCKNEFYTHAVIPAGSAQTCPSCNMLGVAHEQTASFFSSDNRISLYINNQSVPEKALHFNSSTGKCTVEICNHESREFSDITEGGDSAGFSDWIFDGSPLKNELFRIFSRKFYGGKPAPEIHCVSTLENLALLNRFQGYDEPFYHAIPFRVGTIGLNDNFSSASTEAMRTTESAVEFFKTLNLPDHKAIKKLFFLRPELLFFGEQIKLLTFENTDIIRNFYASREVINVFECMQKYPVIACQLKDLTARYGEARIANLLIDDITRIISSFAESLMSGKEFSLYDINVTARMKNTDLNILIQRNPLIETVKIDGYTFFQLRSTGEYSMAAEALSNCLYDPEYFRSEIVCAKKEDKYIAAIEVSDNTVYQAFLEKNKPIGSDAEFNAAYNKWLEYFDFTEEEELHLYDAVPPNIEF